MSENIGKSLQRMVEDVNNIKDAPEHMLTSKRNIKAMTARLPLNEQILAYQKHPILSDDSIDDSTILVVSKRGFEVYK